MNKNKRLRRIYDHMKERCYNKKNNRFTNYGGRGITVCSEWLCKEKVGTSSKGWLAFEKWALENGYRDDLTIDRIDVNGNYSPENCRWASIKEQANNKSNNNYLTYKGKTQTLAEWCRELNLNYNRTENRIKELHWTAEKAFEEKDSIVFTLITYKGKTKCLKDWCKELGVNYGKTWNRIYKQGWSIEKAFETKENVNVILVTYNEETKPLRLWCKELGLKYTTVWNRIYKWKWSVKKALETK